MASNTIRFSGMASGIDTESMVKAMVARYQTKVDDKKKEQTLLEWKKDAYKAMNTKFYSFYTGTASLARLQSTFLKKELASSDTSKVSVKATGSAPEGTHTINEITQLAKSATLETHSIGKVLTDAISGEGVTSSTKLSELGLENNISIKLSDGLKTSELEVNKDWSLKDLSDAIDVVTVRDGLNIRAEYNSINKKFEILSTTGNAQNINISAVDSKDDEALKKIGLKTTNITSNTKLSALGINSQYTLAIGTGGKEAELVIKPDMTLAEFAAEVAQKAPNMSVSFDQNAGAFFISSRKTGISQEISIRVTHGDAGMHSVLSKLGIGNQGSSVYLGLGKNASMSALGIVANDTLSVGSTTITFTGSETIQDVINRISDENPNLNVFWRGRTFEIRDKDTLEFVSLDVKDSEGKPKHLLMSTAYDTSTKLSDLGILDGYNLKIDDGLRSFDVALKGSNTIQDVLDLLNEQIPNVEARWDSSLSTFDIINTNMGSGKPVSVMIEDNDKNGTNIFNMTTLTGKSSVSAQGSNAHYKYNGIDMQSESNSATVNGLEITLNSTTTEAVTITSTANTDEALKFIKKFVEDYNSLIAEANEKRNADSAGKLEPLTNEEKEAMSESDIAEWEKKIKNSLLRRDDTLTDTLYDMRNALASIVEGGNIKTLSKIGITTSNVLKEYGKLEIDENILKAALAEDPEGVTTLFAGGRSAQTAYLEANKDKTAADYEALTDDEKEVWKERVKGIGERLYSALGKRYTVVTDVKSGTVMFNDLLMDKELKTIKSDYEVLVDRLNDKEDYYYKKMAAMEKMMNQLNSQSNYLSSLAGLGGSNK